MTPQERQLLSTFLQQLAQTRADPKDPEADALIREALSRQPDAHYLLVQRAMGLDLALKAAQGQIEKLQGDLDNAKRGNERSFVGNADAWGRSAPARAGTAPAGAAAAPSAWGSGMLGNLATTAAGVVAGSFLYQGIQNLMGHHGPGFGNDPANWSAAASDASDPVADGDQVADLIDDDADDSVAMGGGDFDSSDLG